MSESVLKECEEAESDYDKRAADAAAEFVTNCRFHNHRGIIDCEDKFIIFGNDGYSVDPRARAESEAAMAAVEECGFDRMSLGLSQSGYSWALCVFNYERKLVPTEHFRKVLVDAWAKASANRTAEAT